MVAAAVITTFSAVLNSTVALYSVDFHDKFIGRVHNHWKLGAVVSVITTAIAILLVPVFQNADSIINLLQQLNGLFSMPILSAFIVGLLFRNVAAWAAIFGVLWGFSVYALYTFMWQPAGTITLHYIHFMVIVLASSVLAALAFNRVALSRRAEYIGLKALRAETP
jgi:SSS family solute:Na+ symporter